MKVEVVVKSGKTLDRGTVVHEEEVADLSSYEGWSPVETNDAGVVFIPPDLQGSEFVTIFTPEPEGFTNAWDPRKGPEPPPEPA